MTEEAAKVIPLTADWPGRPLPLMPGDFSKYVPHGMGLAGPLIVRPWDDPLAALTRPNYYGFDPLQSDPVRAAPSQYAGGGIIYFDARSPWDQLQAALTLMEVRLYERDYAVLEGSATDTVAERYLDQVRIVSKGALGEIFGAGKEVAEIPNQPIDLGEYIQQFLSDQSAKWHGQTEPADSLRGTAGGDGDWAKERLAFGFMVENGYWAIYRLWSRAWLITK